MRRSLKTNTLVIVSDQTRGIYKDRKMPDGTFHYTGMGLQGDQSLRAAQNKTLAESSTNGVAVFLFEVFKSTQYTFMGQVELIADPYPEQQLDQTGVIRKVWVFPLRTKASFPVPLTEEEVKKPFKEAEQQARKLTEQQLLKKAQQSPKIPAVHNTLTTTFVRDAYVSAYAKQRANGKCQLCEQEAPFIDSSGRPYLETHHIVWLSQKGEDSIANTVALCPNCHRKMHVLDLSSDKQKLTTNLQSTEAGTR